MILHECADWEIDDQEWWDKLGAGERRGRLEIGAWFLGRLAIAGYEVRRAGKRAWWYRLWAWGQEPVPMTMQETIKAEREAPSRSILRLTAEGPPPSGA